MFAASLNRFLTESLRDSAKNLLRYRTRADTGHLAGRQLSVRGKLPSIKQVILDRLPKRWVARLRRRLHRLSLAYLRLRGKTVVHVLHIGKTGGTDDSLAASTLGSERDDHGTILAGPPKKQRFSRDSAVRINWHSACLPKTKKSGRPRFAP